MVRGREVMIMVNGEKKGGGVYDGVEGGVMEMWRMSGVEMEEKGMMVWEDGGRGEVKVGR